MSPSLKKLPLLQNYSKGNFFKKEFYIAPLRKKRVITSI